MLSFGKKTNYVTKNNGPIKGIMQIVRFNLLQTFQNNCFIH